MYPQIDSIKCGEAAEFICESINKKLGISVGRPTRVPVKICHGQAANSL